MKIIIPVNYLLASEFRNLVNKHSDCEIVNIVEVKTNQILNFHIKCNHELEYVLFDYGFMTFIENPKHQKYYNETDTFKKIAKEYVKQNPAD